MKTKQLLQGCGSFCGIHCVVFSGATFVVSGTSFMLWDKGGTGVKTFLFLIVMGCGSSALAYSDFIGLGYKSCLTCHFNGAGGGALTDYGRALFATEIAAQPFWEKNDEALGESSGFLGKTKLPWWFRPGAKYRGLWFQVNPGSSQSIERFVQMQADISTAFILDKKQKNILMFSLGYVPDPSGGAKSPEADRHFISHEYYWRTQTGTKSFLYLGFMDKAYGIRIPDHTSYSRRQTGVGQQDQAHGLMYHEQTENYEYYVSAFAGNLEQEADYRPYGLSTLIEKDLGEKQRIGMGILAQKNAFVQQNRIEIHSRGGTTNGHSLLGEVGYIQDNAEVGTSFSRAYAYVQGLIRATRGVHILSMGQYFKSELDDSNADQFRWGIGLDYFPMQRVEWRTDVINSRSIAPAEQEHQVG